MFCCTLVPVTSPDQHEIGRDDRVRDGRLGQTKLPSNTAWYCQGVGIFFSEPWVEVRLFHLQLNKWINKLSWIFQEFDLTMVGSRKSQNSRKPWKPPPVICFFHMKIYCIKHNRNIQYVLCSLPPRVALLFELMTTSNLIWNKMMLSLLILGLFLGFICPSTLYLNRKEKERVEGAGPDWFYINSDQFHANSNPFYSYHSPMV